VVTGASSGIGRAIALAMAAEGADVALTYRRSAEAAGSVADRIRAVGREAAVFQADIGVEADVERLVESAFQRFGRVDVWVNNAGADILTGEAARLPDRDRLDRVIAVDLRGTILLSWAVAERMRRQGGGVILNMSWDHVLTGMPDRNPEIFSAVKGGILSFSKSLARSVAPEVRVNVLAPGWIRTAFADEAPEAVRIQVLEATPLRRWGTPEDVAQAAVFLASRRSEFLTGSTLLVNGGTVM
jgi:3-oxoacyl-[acyl-carrier protein] reductase